MFGVPQKSGPSQVLALSDSYPRNPDTFLFCAQFNVLSTQIQLLKELDFPLPPMTSDLLDFALRHVPKIHLLTNFPIAVNHYFHNRPKPHWVHHCFGVAHVGWAGATPPTVGSSLPTVASAHQRSPPQPTMGPPPARRGFFGGRSAW